MRFDGEIIYDTEQGGVHSDFCLNCDPRHEEMPLDDEYREFLHNCLDEWLNKSNGTGAFWVGDYDYFLSWEKE